MKRMNKLIIFALILLISVSAVFADELATASSTIGLDLSDLGYFRIWFSDGDGNSHPGTLELDAPSYYGWFFLNYDLISPKEVTINLSADGALKSASSNINYYIHGIAEGAASEEDQYYFGVKKDSPDINSYESGVDIYSGKSTDKTGIVHCSVLLTDGGVDGKPYELYTASLIAKITVK